MKKAKLFMMLALLVMGVSNTMGATKDYYVNYEREFIEGGFSFDASQSSRISNWSNTRRITKIETLGSITSLGTGAVEDRMIRVTYSEDGWEYYSSGRVNYELAQELEKCITAKDLPNYSEKVWIYYDYKSNYRDPYFGGNTVYITYQYTGSVTSSDTWTNGDFTYSTIYTKTNSSNVKNTIKLPANQCAIKLNTYNKTSVEIPLVDPTKGFKVVALQTQAMCKKETHSIDMPGCNGDDYAPAENSHSNSSLVTVTFKKDGNNQSNVRSIGDYAFQSCKVLRTIEIPQSVEYLGEAAFSMCVGITDGLTFQRTSGASFTTGIKVIRNYTFWMCQNMTSLELPDNIIVIEGQQSGSSMQYMTSLTYLRLPNTLIAVGPHFLCDASSLPEVTIPASVKYIDGACFHGCEKLRKVYLLGPASALQGVYDGSDTFDANPTLCKGNVSNCVFITTQDNIRGYAEDANKVWPLIADNQYGNCNGTRKLPLRAVKVDEDGEVIRTASGGFVYETGDNAYLKYEDGTTNVTTTTCSNGWGNALVYLPDQKVTFTPGKWVTVIFPKSYDWDDFKAEFGQDVILAKMVGYKTPDYKVKDGKIVYQLDFQAQSTVEKNTPYMIKPGHRIVGNNDPYEVVMIQANEMNEDYRKELSKDHALSADKASFNTEIVMYGWFKKRDMKQWELYFQNPIDETTQEWNKHCVFKRIVNKDQAPKIRPFRCYWRIWLEGEDREDAGMSSAKSAFFRFADEDEQVTGIDQVDSNISIEIGNIYDLNGRKLDLKKEELPKGLFIIDGKKVMVK